MIMFDYIIDYLYKAMDWYENELKPISKPLGETIMALSFVFLVADALLWKGGQELLIAIFLIVGAVLRQLGIWGEESPTQRQSVL